MEFPIIREGRRPFPAAGTGGMRARLVCIRDTAHSLRKNDGRRNDAAGRSDDT